MVSWWNWKLMNFKVDEIESWWNWKLMKLKVDEIESWWNWKLMKLKVDEIESWWNYKLMKWHNTNATQNKITFSLKSWNYRNTGKSVLSVEMP